MHKSKELKSEMLRQAQHDNKGPFVILRNKVTKNLEFMQSSHYQGAYMSISMTARYQVKPQALERCKKAIRSLAEHVQENEKETLFYMAQQEKLNPYAFLHVMVFKDEVALTMHRSSKAAETFVNTIYPEAIDPLEFKEYIMVGTNLNI